MPTKAPKETRTPNETKAPKAGKAQSGKAEPASEGGQKPNALQKLLRPSKELAAVVGAEPLPRGEVVSKVSGTTSRSMSCRTRKTGARSWRTTSWRRCSAGRR